MEPPQKRSKTTSQIIPRPIKYYPKRFNLQWLLVPEFKGWIQKSTLSESLASCKCCGNQMRAHKHDIRKHAVTKVHQRNWRLYKEREGLKSPENDEAEIDSYLEKLDYEVQEVKRCPSDDSYQEAENVTVTELPEEEISFQKSEVLSDPIFVNIESKSETDNLKNGRRRKIFNSSTPSVGECRTLLYEKVKLISTQTKCLERKHVQEMTHRAEEHQLRMEFLRRENELKLKMLEAEYIAKANKLQVITEESLDSTKTMQKDDDITVEIIQPID